MALSPPKLLPTKDLQRFVVEASGYGLTKSFQRHTKSFVSGTWSVSVETAIPR